ncbi:MAG TPA: hypothetical protein VFB21_15860 [Chthonomonadaceae bacterium]|nr:hypothetical protein [Chthonomonadaceae bacterium]
MNKGRVRPSEELRHFTNREKETTLFQRYVNAVEGSPLPVLMFYGVGGIGKTWLTKRLRAMLEEPPFVSLPGQSPLPSARLDLEPVSGSLYHNDPAAAYLKLRLDLGVDCPSFDLAYAMLRYRQGAGEEPQLRHSGTLHTAWEFIGEASGKAAESIPGGSLTLWAAKKVTERLGHEFKETALGKRLLTTAGNAEFFDLRHRDTDDLYKILPERLARDLEANLPPRSGKACRAVVFLDSFESLQRGIDSAIQQVEREKWVGALYENLQSVLIVIAGRDRLNWDEVDADWRSPDYLEQHLLGGLSRYDAETFLGQCGVTQGRLQRAVLEACVDIEATAGSSGDTAYHPYSLGLCADTIVNERNRGVETDPASFDMAPGDYDRLAQRFLKSLPNDAQADWIARLALTPRFDEQAARYAYSPLPGADQNAAWDDLEGYSFITRAEQADWRTLHPRMKAALRRRLAPPDEPDEERRHQTDWRDYWQSRAQSDTDDYTALAWYHCYQLEPEPTRLEWDALAERSLGGSKPDMALHHRLLDWWTPTGIENGPPANILAAPALNSLGLGLGRTSLGRRDANVRRAIACFETALQVCAEADYSELWATLHNNLGLACHNLPTGDRGRNLERAIACYEAALRVYTEQSYPEDWARIQSNLATVYGDLPTGDRGQNLQQAIACCEAALRVRTEERTPVEWAATQHNMGNAYARLRMGDRAANLQKALACYEAALRVRTEQEMPVEWAMVQGCLGNVYTDLPTEDKSANLQQAIGCYEAALRVYTEQDYPYDWALTHNNLGLAYVALPDGDKIANLQRAMDCYAAALRVYTEPDDPSHWAMTQCNLGVAYQSLPAGDRRENLERAAACYEAALRVYTEPNYPYECAMTRSNLALARKEQGDFAGAKQALLLAAQAYRQIGMEEGVREVEEELAGLPESE